MSATPDRSVVPRPLGLPARRGAHRGRLTTLVIALVVALVIVAVVWPVDHTAAELIRLLLAVGASTMEIVSWLGGTDRQTVAEGQVSR